MKKYTLTYTDENGKEHIITRKFKNLTDASNHAAKQSQPGKGFMVESYSKP